MIFHILRPSLKVLKIYLGENSGIYRDMDESSAYILSEELESITDRMKAILKMSRPYNFIKELPELMKDFS